MELFIPQSASLPHFSVLHPHSLYENPTDLWSSVADGKLSHMNTKDKTAVLPTLPKDI